MGSACSMAALLLLVVHICIYIYIWYDMIWYDMIWYGMVWYDMVWNGMIWYGMYDMIYDIWSMIYDIWHVIYDIYIYIYDMIWYDMTWYDMIWYDMIWYEMRWYDIWYDMILYYMVWYDMIWYDMILYGMYYIYNIWSDIIFDQIWYVIYMIYYIWYMIYDIWYIPKSHISIHAHYCVHNNLYNQSIPSWVADCLPKLPTTACIASSLRTHRHSVRPSNWAARLPPCGALLHRWRRGRLSVHRRVCSQRLQAPCTQGYQRIWSANVSWGKCQNNECVQTSDFGDKMIHYYRLLQ